MRWMETRAKGSSTVCDSPFGSPLMQGLTAVHAVHIPPFRSSKYVLLVVPALTILTADLGG